MKFTLVYIIALVIFSVNGVLSGISKSPSNGVSSGRSKTLRDGVSSRKSKTPNKGFCSGKTISDGTQIPGGSCSVGIQGVIPSSDKMPSTLIVHPPNGGELLANIEFDVDIVVDNLATGHFSDPDTKYNILPQTLDDTGVIIGHTHVTIQELNGDVPPDSKKFAFFKGVNNKAGSGGKLTVSVINDDGKKGLPAGKYRICAMTGAFSHQPPVLPVAKRGAQDDCIRIDVNPPR